MNEGISCVSCFLVNTDLDSWIVDSSATNLIYFSLNLFTTHRKICHVPVRMPNGNMAMAEVAGTRGDHCVAYYFFFCFKSSGCWINPTAEICAGESCRETL